jgi:hypothetical protein
LRFFCGNRKIVSIVIFLIYRISLEIRSKATEISMIWGINFLINSKNLSDRDNRISHIQIYYNYNILNSATPYDFRAFSFPFITRIYTSWTEIKLRIIFILSVLIPIRDIVKKLILKALLITLYNRNNLIPKNNLEFNFINYIFI